MERRRHTVMMAEDDPEILRTSSEALERAGYRVVRTADGQRALEEALHHKVDLIIMDISMPQVNGVDACHCLKAMPKTSRIPVVLTAAKKDPTAKLLGERMNCSVRVLRKPFDPEQLVSVAKDLVRPKALL